MNRPLVGGGGGGEGGGGGGGGGEGGGGEAHFYRNVDIHTLVLVN